jgi:uncharacterized membrane protein YhaH (DUF805 family)
MGRRDYAVIGVLLTIVKVNVDRAVAGLYGEYWDPIEYWIPSGASVDGLTRSDAALFGTLAAIAVPFVWAGIALTLRRLRDADLSPWLVGLFFVPFVNVLLFLVLCAVPSTARESDGAARSDRLGRLLPHGAWASAATGLAVTAALSVSLTLLGTVVLETYGWGLFLGIPFLTGVVSAVVYGYHEPRPLGSCIGVALLSVGLASVLLVGLAIEGVICVAMAAPLAAVLAVFGGLVGYAVQRRGPVARANGAFSIAVLALPVLLGAESAVAPAPAVLPVRTSIVVDAPPDVVWRHVVSFAELPPPDELVFRAGISYPTAAVIEGRGVGAVRRCRFSTGDFVEPITRWDEPRLLAFSVASQPPPLRELSPWGAIHPPHLDGFLRSRRGEFRLRSLPGGRTLLEGTTWYENRMWPAPYWRLWSDELIHRIHRRVLEHVAREAESSEALYRLLTEAEGETSKSGNRFTLDEHPGTRPP